MKIFRNRKQKEIEKGRHLVSSMYYLDVKELSEIQYFVSTIENKNIKWGAQEALAEIKKRLAL